MKHVMFRVIALLAIAGPLSTQLVAQQAPAAPPLTQKLGTSPDIKVGTLPNGLRYYIRKNAEPAKRAELRLVVNAGSILEDDDQLGYAHFLEHTAFNGTTHFKKNDLVQYLQSIGVRFGADLNASTSFDETIYQLSVPTDTARLVETAFLILEDWAHGQTFDSTEVVNERGVVLEEWRGRLGAGDRMSRVTLPIILKDSRYATRIPIGTEESINTANPAALRRFYNDWYRPDLMAVVAVGDFDPATIESLIKQHFAAIPRPKNPRPRVEAVVPANKAPLVAIASDPEATGSGITIGFKRPVTTITTVGDYRERIKRSLYFAMINARLVEIGQKADAPFLGASVSSGSFFARNVSAFTFGAGVKDGGVERGAEAVLAEARRVDQFGFLPTELQRVKVNILRGNERMYAERATVRSASMVGDLIGNFLFGSSMTSLEEEYKLTSALVPGISLEEVNTLARDWITEDNRVVLINTPRKTGLAVPTEAQVLAMLERSATTTLTPYTETLTDAPLLDHVAAPGRVVSTSANAAVGVTEWKLSNGARVLVKPTDFKADEVLFTAYSPGGTSLVSDADYQSAVNASGIMGLSGVGNFSSIDLGKKLAGKAASAGASIGSLTEGLGGSASPKDLETMFQLIYLRFTAPRLDTAAWLVAKARMDAALANRSVSPAVAFSDTLTVTMTQHHFRARPISAALVNEINPKRALEIYKDRFANAGDFTFVFVGNINLDSLKPLVEKYLGALPGTGRVEKWKDIGIAAPTGVVERVVNKGTEPKAATQIIFTGPFKYSPQTRLDMLALTALSQIWLTQVIREELGGSYSPSLNGGGAQYPRGEYSISIGFESSPDNVEKLTSRTFRMIDSLKTNGPTEADIVKVKEQLVRSRETSVKTNGYWISSIAARDQANEDLAGLLKPYDDMVANINAKQIQDAAKLYFNMKQYVKIVLLPEKPVP